VPGSRAAERSNVANVIPLAAYSAWIHELGNEDSLASLLGLGEEFKGGVCLFRRPSRL